MDDLMDEWPEQPIDDKVKCFGIVQNMSIEEKQTQMSNKVKY